VKDRQVELGVKLKKGKHTMRIDGLNTLGESYIIELEDKVAGALVEMNANSEYTFTIDEDIEANDRFVLHFGKTQVSTDIEDMETDGETSVRVYIENSSKLVVNCDWKGIKQVYLFTIDGKMVSNNEFKDEKYFKELNLKPGIYVVKVIGDNEKFEQKVFVK
jgi:hypothetical protein